MDFYLSAFLQGLCFSGLALGIYLSMKIFAIPDITTDGSYTLGGVVTAVLLSRHWPFWTVLPIAAAAGAAAGALTGIIHTRLKINPLLAGILVMTSLYSVNLALMGRSNLPLSGDANMFAAVRLFAFPDFNSLFVLIIVTSILVSFLGYLLKTDFGIAMRATGNSESMVRAMGVNTDRMKIIGLAIANALTAISGFLMVEFQGFADINMGIGIVITGLGSVVIGEALIGKFRRSAVFTHLALVLGGAVVFQLALALTLTIGADPAWLKFITAAFVLVAVGATKVSIRKNA